MGEGKREGNVHSSISTQVFDESRSTHAHTGTTVTNTSDTIATPSTATAAIVARYAIQSRRHGRGIRKGVLCGGSRSEDVARHRELQRATWRAGMPRRWRELVQVYVLMRQCGCGRMRQRWRK